MKKLRVYLDTSVVSHLDQPDAPDKTRDTIALWEDFKSGAYDAVISDLTLAEIDDCAEPKRSFMRMNLAEISYEEVYRNDETLRLSVLYFEHGGLPPKSKDDALHIAIATVYGCDIILSWNFRHIVNFRAITAVESVNIKQGYRTLRIMPPSMLLEKGE
jgi:predicted nucleic acid-binding protein